MHFKDEHFFLKRNSFLHQCAKNALQHFNMVCTAGLSQAGVVYQPCTSSNGEVMAEKLQQLISLIQDWS